MRIRYFKIAIDVPALKSDISTN